MGWRKAMTRTVSPMTGWYFLSVIGLTPFSTRIGTSPARLKTTVNIMEHWWSLNQTSALYSFLPCRNISWFIAVKAGRAELTVKVKVPCTVVLCVLCAFPSLTMNMSLQYLAQKVPAKKRKVQTNLRLNWLTEVGTEYPGEDHEAGVYLHDDVLRAAHMVEFGQVHGLAGYALPPWE